jgi:hypothetical protein
LQEKYDFSDQQITKKIVPEAHVYQKKLLPEKKKRIVTWYGGTRGRPGGGVAELVGGWRSG